MIHHRFAKLHTQKNFYLIDEKPLIFVTDPIGKSNRKLFRNWVLNNNYDTLILFCRLKLNLFHAHKTLCKGKYF